jgi:hypothetical protein
VKRVSAVLAGLLIGMVGALLFIGSPAPVAPPVVRPVASEAPATVAPRTCDQAIPVTLPNTSLETLSLDRSPDGTSFVLGARVYHRMGPYVPLEQRVLMLSLSSLEFTDLAAGTDPRFSGSGSRIAYRAPRPQTDALSTEIVVFDLAAKREVARIAGVSATAFGWRGEELLFWRGNELQVWADARESRVIDAPRTVAGVYVDVRYSGDGERAVMSFYDQRPGRVSAPAESYVIDTRAATSRSLIGAWWAEPSPRGHAVFASYLDHRELQFEDGRVLSAPIPFTGGVVVWAPDGRLPLLSPNELIPFDSTAELETLDGQPAGLAVPALAVNSGFAEGGDLFAGVRPGGMGPSRMGLFRCRIDARPAQPTVTLYYGESSFEPWAARRDGTAPAGWEQLVMRDLETVGLHPIAVGRTTSPVPQIACVQPTCPTGFVLRIVIPYAERDRAYARCFREPYAGNLTLGAAIASFHCVPLYAAD